MKAVTTVTALSAMALTERVSDALYELEESGNDVVGLSVSGNFVLTVVITYEDNRDWEVQLASYRRRHDPCLVVFNLAAWFLLLVIGAAIAAGQIHTRGWPLVWSVGATIMVMTLGLVFLELIGVAMRLSVSGLGLYLLAAYVGMAFFQWLLPTLPGWGDFLAALGVQTALLYVIKLVVLPKREKLEQWFKGKSR